MRYYTPLRYPGGKASLGQYMRQVFVDNRLLGGVIKKPYAGGAAHRHGAAHDRLCRGGIAQRHRSGGTRILACCTPRDESARRASRNNTADRIGWRGQRAIYLQPDKHDTLTLGFATLFLNRTNRSGILNGGVIGGLSQKGQWLMDARFNRSDLAERIRRIGHYRHRIRLFNEDAEVFLRCLNLPKQSLIYLDPPYFHRGQKNVPETITTGKITRGSLRWFGTKCLSVDRLLRRHTRDREFICWPASTSLQFVLQRPNQAAGRRVDDIL